MNFTRIKININCCVKFCKGKEKYSVNFKYDNKTETYDICVGMPILATVNIKDCDMFNTMMFKDK